MKNSEEKIPYFTQLAEQLLADNEFGPSSQRTKAQVVLKLMYGYEHDIDPIRCLSDIRIIPRHGKLTVNDDTTDGELEDGDFQYVQKMQFAIDYHYLLDRLQSSEKYTLQVISATEDEAHVALLEFGQHKWSQRFSGGDAERLGWSNSEIYCERATELNLAEAIVSTLDIHGIWTDPVYIRLLSTHAGRLHVKSALLRSVGSIDLVFGNGFEAAICYETL